MDGVHYSVTGEGKDDVGNRYIEISIAGADKALIFATDKIVSDPKNLFAALANKGVNLFSAASKAELLKALQESTSAGPKFRVIRKVGHSSKQFNLPSITLGQPTGRSTVVLDHLDQAMVRKYQSGGTLEAWQTNIAEPSDGNTRLMFAVSLALSGPVLRYVPGPRTGGFQIFGSAETGKTTAMMVAGSVWGCHVGAERREKGFAESWHTTAGKVETTALAHNDTILLLDETSVAGATPLKRAELISGVSFTLAEGTERERLTNSASARSWRGYFLSTSNLSYAEIAIAGKIEISDAHIGRMFDIPCPTGSLGIYDTIDGFDSGERMTDVLKKSCRQTFGTAGPAFVDKLLKDRDEDKAAFKLKLERQRRRYRRALHRMVDAEKLCSLKRVDGRFSTVFAAGWLAIKYGILPWSSAKLMQAILACHLDGLRHYANAKIEKPRAERLLREKLVGYLQDTSTFVDLGDHRPTLLEDDLETPPGYIGVGKEAGWLYLTPKRLQIILGSSTATAAFKTHLMANGMMAKPKTGFVVQRRIFSGGEKTQNYAWVCAFNPKLARP